MSLTRNLLRGSMASVLDLVVKTMAMFVTTPIMVKSVGQEAYGSWLLVLSIVSYLMVLDLGVTFSATRLMAIQVGAGGGPRLLALQQQVRRYFALVGWISTAAIIVMLPLIPWLTNGTHTRELIWVLLLCGGATVLRYWNRSALIRLRASVRYDLVACVSLVRTVCQAVAMCLVLLRGGGLIGAAIVQASGELLELVLQSWAASTLPANTDCTVSEEDTAAAKRELASNSRDVSLATIGGALRRETNPVLISTLFGVSQVPIYSLGMRLISLLEDLINAVFGGQVLAALSQLHGAGDREALVRQFLRLTHLTAACCAGAMGGVLWLSEMFLHRWLGEGLSPAAQVTWVLAVPYALSFMLYPANNILFTTGRTHWMTMLIFSGGCLSAILSITFGLLWGFMGVVTGCAIAMLVERVIVLPYLLSRCLQLNPLVYMLKDVLLPAIRGTAPALLFAWLTSSWLTPDYWRIFLLAGCYTAVFLLTAPWLAFDAPTRQLLWRALPWQKRYKSAQAAN